MSVPREGTLARLWAPWRLAYVGKADQAAGCLFCRVGKSRDDRAHLVLARRRSAYLLLNRYPYNSGHLMVAVTRHVAELHDLRPGERDELMELAALAERALAVEYRPHGFNLGANLGKVAGAGFPGHLHLHVVPRWNGDTNFMPVTGGTKVLPESLSRTWARLKSSIRTLESAKKPRSRRTD
ncbi:MAG: HIT family protein [Candidatus Eiseniibacteriota bacterium]